jgi:hypothetical protein
MIIVLYVLVDEIPVIEEARMLRDDNIKSARVNCLVKCLTVEEEEKEANKDYSIEGGANSQFEK